eukprot:m.75925 g.75925  ORF g.75925 m.75925 type:complete len:534 (-) comp9029_c0_seq1:1474-3075(-)
MDKYRVLGKIGEGTFSTVWKCTVIDKNHELYGQACSVKRMKKKYESIDHVNSLREVQALKRLNPHPNILNLIEVIYTEELQALDLVCELLTENLYEKIKDRKQPLPTDVVKSYMYQLLKALEHMHRNGIFHRDVKPENILLDGATNTLKLADFGSCRGIYSKVPFTEYISTRWYRAPECLLTDGYYGFKMDTWSVGCVFFEVSTLRPLFPGANEMDQLDKIHGIIGVPKKSVLEKIRKNSMHMSFKFRETHGCGLARCLPHGSAHFLDLLCGLLEYDPDERMSARQALRHPFFAEQRKADPSRRSQAQAQQSDEATTVPAGTTSKPTGKKKHTTAKSTHRARDPAGHTTTGRAAQPTSVKMAGAPHKHGATTSSSMLPHVTHKAGMAKGPDSRVPVPRATGHKKPMPPTGPRDPHRVVRIPKRSTGPRAHHKTLPAQRSPPKWQASMPRHHSQNRQAQQHSVYSHSYMTRSNIRNPVVKPKHVAPVLPPLVLKQVKPQASPTKYNPAKYYTKVCGHGSRRLQMVCVLLHPHGH